MENLTFKSNNIGELKESIQGMDEIKEAGVAILLGAGYIVVLF